jgi:hypothetical protein
MEIDMTNNTASLVEAYLSAKFAAEQAEAALKAVKAEVVAMVGGYGFLEGMTADIDVAVQSKASINEKLLLQVLSQDQINACKVEGAAYPVLRIKAKRKMAA